MGTVTTGLMRAEAQAKVNYVVIQGAGGLGIHATAMAKDMGADRVIILDRFVQPVGAGRGIWRRPYHQHRRVQHGGDQGAAAFGS